MKKGAVCAFLVMLCMTGCRGPVQTLTVDLHGVKFRADSLVVSVKDTVSSFRQIAAAPVEDSVATVKLPVPGRVPRIGRIFLNGVSQYFVIEPGALKMGMAPNRYSKYMESGQFNTQEIGTGNTANLERPKLTTGLLTLW